MDRINKIKEESLQLIQKLNNNINNLVEENKKKDKYIKQLLAEKTYNQSEEIEIGAFNGSSDWRRDMINGN